MGHPEAQVRATAEGRATAYWAEVAPRRVAVRSAHGDRTFAELEARANRLVRALRKRGLRAGDGVALVMRNRPEFVEVWAACRRAGWHLTPINWHLTAEEMRYIVDDSGARALVVDTTITAALELAAGLRDEGPCVVAVGGAVGGAEGYDDALAAESPDAIDGAEPGTLMLYTSGTTGRPKGVRKRPQPPVVENLAGYDETSAHLVTGPLYHAAPLIISLVSPISNGATVVLMDGWDPVDTLRLVEEHSVSHTHMVPTMFHRLLAVDDDTRARYDVSSLRLVVHGAAPCPVPVKRAMIDWVGPVVVEYYAATEGAGTLVDAGTWLTKPGTVGKPFPPDQVIVGDDDANALPPNEVGTVWLKSPPGDEFEYYGDPEKTQRSQRGAYYTLGDHGYVDDDGFLFLSGRSAEVIISGGVNIYPAEIDAVLLEHAAVRDAATIGVPDDDWGESVLAVVEPADPAEAGEELAAELLALCRTRLAGFKCPRMIEFTDALPRQDNGKVYRRVLRDRYATGA